MSVIVHNTAGGGGSSVIIDGTEFKGILELSASTTPTKSVSTLPYEFYYDSAVVYNDEIHILGDYSGESLNSHYKWNGSSWTSVSTLPYLFYKGSAVVYDNEIHILGSYSNTKMHYKWNGSSWKTTCY